MSEKLPSWQTGSREKELQRGARVTYSPKDTTPEAYFLQIGSTSYLSPALSNAII
jgi:hypothetical protein